MNSAAGKGCTAAARTAEGSYYVLNFKRIRETETVVLDGSFGS